MNAKHLILFFFLTPLVVGSVMAQKTFYGTVEYTYEVTGAEAAMMAMMLPQKMVIQYGKAGMSTEMEGGMMSGMLGRMVVNSKTDERFSIKDSEKTVYMMDKEEVDKAQESVKDQLDKPQKLDETAEILGYTCHKYRLVINTPQGSMEQFIWATDKLTPPEIALPDNPTIGSLDFGVDGMPMKVEIALPGTSSKLIMLATDIDADEPDPALFERPESYTIKKFSELMPAGMGF